MLWLVSTSSDASSGGGACPRQAAANKPVMATVNRASSQAAREQTSLARVNRHFLSRAAAGRRRHWSETSVAGQYIHRGDPHSGSSIIVLRDRTDGPLRPVRLRGACHPAQSRKYLTNGASLPVPGSFSLLSGLHCFVVLQSDCCTKLNSSTRCPVAVRYRRLLLPCPHDFGALSAASVIALPGAQKGSAPLHCPPAGQGPQQQQRNRHQLFFSEAAHTSRRCLRCPRGCLHGPTTPRRRATGRPSRPRSTGVKRYGPSMELQKQPPQADRAKR